MVSFSERYGYKKVRDTIQKERIDEPLKNALWNIIYAFILKGLNISDKDKIDQINESLYKSIWVDYLKKTIDTYPRSFDGYLRNYFFNESKWFEIYDLLEFVAKDYSIYSDWYNLKETANEYRQLFTSSCNDRLKEYLSAYRFVNNEITEMTTEEEIKEIEIAINSPINEIREHLSKALNHLSNRKNPDYRNSIKESISAVECLCRKITGESTLDRALNKIESKGIEFNSQLKQGLEKIYHYTNGEGGIRHSLMDMNKELEQEDAKFILVACSAFINYLIEKVEKAGIKYD